MANVDTRREAREAILDGAHSVKCDLDNVAESLRNELRNIEQIRDRLYETILGVRIGASEASTPDDEPMILKLAKTATDYHYQAQRELRTIGASTLGRLDAQAIASINRALGRLE